MNWTFVSEQIEELRKRAGISKSKLAQVTGYSPSMIHRILDAKRGVGPTGLMNLARFFDVPLFILVDGPLPADEPLLHFKDEDRTVFPEALYPRAKGYAYRFADVYRLLFGEPTDLASIRPKLKDPVERGAKAADNLRATLGHPGGKIASMVEFVTKLGVAVAEVDDPKHRLKGVAFRWAADLQLIVVAADQRITSKRFILAHELGHLLLEDLQGSINRRNSGREEQNLDFFAADPHEQAANAFAARLLLPEQDLKPFIEGRSVLKAGNPVDVWQNEITHLSREYGVSSELVYWRLCQAGMYSQALARQYKKSLYSHPCSQGALDTVFLETEDCTRLTLSGIQPSQRYRNWISILTARDSINSDEASHLLGPHLEAA